MSASWTLTGRDGAPYQSDRPGTLGGHRRSKLYGRLDCRSELQALARGGYALDRVCFLDEHAAQAAGYQPCVVCLPDHYADGPQPAHRRPLPTIRPTVPDRSHVPSPSPRTPPPRPDFPEGDGAATELDLRTVLAQLERLGARLVSVRHGRDRRSRLAAEHFAAACNASTDRNGLERSVAVMVDWAADAASWLKPARRLTEPDADAWVISATPHTWAQMSHHLQLPRTGIPDEPSRWPARTPTTDCAAPVPTGACGSSRTASSPSTPQPNKKR
jgi:hypothetical protein